MFSVFALAVLAVTARAEFVPLTPSPGMVFNQGAACSFSWAGDKTSDAWKTTNVQLMTGNNFQMIHLDTVATVDGTQDGRFEFPCPEVNPNAPVYFYQFSTPEDPQNKTWATRFTIASATGETVEAENPVQPGSNEAIPWGVGALVDPSKARPAPAYLTGGSSTGAPPTSISASASVSGSASASISGSGSPSALPSVSASSSPSGTRASLTSPSGKASSAASVTPSNNSTEENSAGSVVVDSRVWQTAVALGVSAMTFSLFL